MAFGRNRRRPGSSSDMWQTSESPTESPRPRNRRERRREDIARQRALLRERRRSEPASPIGVIAVIVLLAVIVLGVGGGLPRLFGDEGEQGPTGLLTPGDSATSGPDEGETTVPISTPNGPLPVSTPPPQTQRPGAEATVAADEATRSWAKVFYTRQPARETYAQLVERAAQFTTRELADSFRASVDSTYGALRDSGGTSRVLSVSIVKPRPDTAPVDTPTRITRLVNINIETTGDDAGRFAVPLLVTVMPDSGRWLVSAVDGGTGP
ncbi:hypothetical protein [Kribbella sp. NPDC048915]|uniref:hypothetical protein n=1 Tax=Kribbella sp. NPDC048915 TaxID=3155148 RepID=UPI0033D83D7B